MSIGAWRQLSGTVVSPLPKSPQQGYDRYRHETDSIKVEEPAQPLVDLIHEIGRHGAG
jgi:hypothetical protein